MLYRLIIFFFLGCIPAHSQVQVIHPSIQQVMYSNGYVYCDSSSRLSIGSILKISQDQYKPFTPEFGPFRKDYTYWIRFDMPRLPSEGIVLLENVMYQRLLEVYCPTDSGSYEKYRCGFDIPYTQWPLRYYKSVLPVPVHRLDKPYFLKVVPASSSGFGIQTYNIIERLNTETDHAFFNGLFFGICFLISLYTLIFFLFIREKTFLFYSLYVISFSLYGIVDRKIILWPLANLHLNWHDDYYTIPYACMTIFLLLYSRSFLETKKQMPLFSKILLGSAIARVIIYFVGLITKSDFFYNPNLDNLLLLSAWIAGIASWVKGYKPARYLTLGFTVLYLGLLEHSLHYIEWLPLKVNVFSISNSGIAEIILFSLALADRFRILKNEKETATAQTVTLQEQMIKQLQETDLLKDKMNRELEFRVHERTEELQTANESIRKMNELLREHNIRLESDIQQIAEKRVMDETVTFEEFQKIYPDEDSCYKLIEELKWTHGFVCIKCSNTKFSKGTTPYSRRCSKCNYIERITSNTIFSRVKIPINKAFYMLFLVFSKKKITLSQLSVMLDIRSQTCWAFKQKIDTALASLPKNRKSKEDWKDVILLASPTEEN